MDIGQIEAFIQVANYKSFSRAAQAIHLTQPSITARIQALERDLDEELFERHGRRLLLTDAGKAFLPYARQVLKTIQEGRDAVAEVAGLKAGSLQLGVLPTIGSYLLPRLLLDFGGRYPNIDVAVFNRPNEQILQLVLSDQVHLGILRPQNHPDIENIPLFDDEIILVVHPGHPFVKAEKVTFQGLARERLVVFGRESHYFPLVYEMFKQAGTEPNSSISSDSMEATKHMVEEGLGVSLVPRLAVERELSAGSLVKIPIADSQLLRWPISIIYRKGRKLPHSAQAFLDVMAQRFQQPLVV